MNIWITTFVFNSYGIKAIIKCYIKILRLKLIWYLLWNGSQRCCCHERQNFPYNVSREEVSLPCLFSVYSIYTIYTIYYKHIQYVTLYYICILYTICMPIYYILLFANYNSVIFSCWLKKVHTKFLVNFCSFSLFILVLILQDLIQIKRDINPILSFW